MGSRVSQKIADLVDLIEREPGWRVEDTSNGWRIYPPDKAFGVIHLRDFREIEFTMSALRRAGFKPLLKLKEIPMKRATAEECAPVATPPAPVPAAAPPPPPRDLIAEARAHINAAVESLSALDGVLGEIQHEREAFSQIKSLFQTMLK